MAIYKEMNPIGRKVLLISAGSVIWECGLYDRILEQLDELGTEIFELFDVELDAPAMAVHHGVALCEEEGIELLLAVGHADAVDTARGIAAALQLPEHAVWDFTKIQEEVLRTVVKYLPALLRRPSDREARENLNRAEDWVRSVFSHDRVLQELVACMTDPEMLAFCENNLVSPSPWLSVALDEETAPVIRRFGVNVLGVEEALPVMEGAKEAISLFSSFLLDTLVLWSGVSDLMLEDGVLAPMAV